MQFLASDRVEMCVSSLAEYIQGSKPLIQVIQATGPGDHDTVIVHTKDQSRYVFYIKNTHKFGHYVIQVMDMEEHVEKLLRLMFLFVNI